jgi:hypothetical protein
LRFKKKLVALMDAGPSKKVEIQEEIDLNQAGGDSRRNS